MSLLDGHSEQRMSRDLALRARDGAWGHPLCLGLVFLTTTLLTDRPLEMGLVAAGMLIQTGIRVALLRNVLPTAAWRNKIVALLLASGAAWGLLVAWSCKVYGYHGPNTMLLLLYQAAIAVVGTPTLVHDPRLTRLYLVFLFGPPMICHGLFPDTDRWGPLCAFVFYGIFLGVRGARETAEYHRRLAEHQGLTEVASSDSLTGLSNRFRMQHSLAEAIAAARKNGSRIAFLFIDLDGFKEINDTLSHKAGDLYLREIARRLASCAGARSEVSRLGGDEFTIMLPPQPDDSRRDALNIANLVLSAVREAVLIDGRSCSTTASIGVSFFPDDADTDDELVRTADHAMYEAKRTGANQVCFAGSRRGASLVAE